MELDLGVVLALAPTPGVQRSARALAIPSVWPELAHDDKGLWGRCQGSASSPYRVMVDLRGGPAWSCSCPSSLQPCKHVVALLLLTVADLVPDVGGGVEPPDVAAWLTGREGRAEEAAAKARARAEKKGAPIADPAAQARRKARRAGNVDTGVIDLERWLDDLARNGLAGAQARPRAAWEATAARLVDAQARGLAGRVRSMAMTTASGPGWPERLLAQAGRLHLLMEGWRHLDDLPDPLQDEVRTQLGFDTRRDDVMARAAERDTWDVLAWTTTDDGTLGSERVWLRGRTIGGWALLQRFGPSGLEFSPEVPFAHGIDADVHRYPGALAQRSLVGLRHGDPSPIPSLDGGTVLDALAADAANLARNPWLAQSPVALTAVVPVPGSGDDPWLVVDEAGDALPLAFPSWSLLAVSGGHPVGVVGEWDGHRLSPLSVWSDGHLSAVGA